MTFDMEATFGDDYLYFYEESIDEAHSDADTAEILGLLGPARPAPASSMRPAATGASPAGWPRRAWQVTGVDLTPAYLEQARADPHLRPGQPSPTSRGTSAPCPSTDPSTPSSAG